MTKNYKDAWKNPIPKNEWETFLNETFQDAAREKVKELLTEYVQERERSVCEIGFGQGYDFLHIFKPLYEAKKIIYAGYDITKQFVDYAKETFPVSSTCNFSNEDILYNKKFNDIKFDIVYLRHVLEHQPPDKCYVALEKVLTIATNYAIVVWFKPPGNEEFLWIDTDGIGGTGAQVNTFSEEKIASIASQKNFSIERIPAGNSIIYVFKNNTDD